MELKDYIEVGDIVEVDIWDGFREIIQAKVKEVRPDRKSIIVHWPHKGFSWSVALGDDNVSPDTNACYGKVIQKICPVVESIRNG